jgi:hypothetical protein
MTKMTLPFEDTSDMVVMSEDEYEYGLDVILDGFERVCDRV